MEGAQFSNFALGFTNRLLIFSMEPSASNVLRMSALDSPLRPNLSATTYASTVLPRLLWLSRTKAAKNSSACLSTNRLYQVANLLPGIMFAFFMAGRAPNRIPAPESDIEAVTLHYPRSFMRPPGLGVRPGEPGSDHRSEEH